MTSGHRDHRGAIALPEASPRDREVQHVVLQLVEAYAFGEAAAVLLARLREIDESRRSHIEMLFLEWRERPPEDRPDFLTYAHHRRNPELRS
ncbi:MAG: hypothetical protein QM699_07650 [Amaricoccus sp.]|uniref:hypothetical protein n=1 Tax=Amaricoccus sp. TaxID=1872485 RepID=UPI0039E4DB9E